MSYEERVSATGKIEEAQGSAMREKGNGGNLALAIWVLALFTAFLFGSTIVNVIISRQAREIAKSQVQAVRDLNESMMEVRKSLAEFSGVFQDAHETDGFEESNPFLRSDLGDEKV